MPSLLVKPIHYAWLKTLLVSINNTYAQFVVFINQQLADATIDSSVNRLTKALNDKFDPTGSIYLLQNDDYLAESFIYLETDTASPEYDYLESEDHEPADYDYLDDEYSHDYNFIVRIPVAIADKSAQINRFVGRYVFSGIKYTVETF